MCTSAEGSTTTITIEGSNIEAEINHVAVPHDVIASLQARHAALAGGGIGAGGHQVIERGDLGADKAALHVAVDLPACLGRPGALAHRPPARLGLAGGKERDQPEHGIPGASESFDPALVEAPVPP